MQFFITVLSLHFYIEASGTILCLCYNCYYLLCLSNSGKKITVTVASSDLVCSAVPTPVCISIVAYYMKG